VQLAALRPWIKPAAYIGLASVSCFLFTAWTPPLLDLDAALRAPIVGSLISSLPRGQEAYWLRFALSFLLLGAAPLVLALAFGARPSDLGLRLRSPILRSPWFWCALPAAILVGAIGAASPDIAAYYPYAPDLAARVASEGALPFLVHYAAYFFLYYLPWEFFFRGFLILGLAACALPGWAPSVGRARAASPDTSTTTGGAAAGQGAVAGGGAALAAALVLFQTMPSTMLHVGHPMTELASAVIAGLGFGILAWKSGSILPGLLIHAAIGLGTDGFIVLKGAGII